MLLNLSFRCHPPFPPPSPFPLRTKHVGRDGPVHGVRAPHVVAKRARSMLFAGSAPERHVCFPQVGVRRRVGPGVVLHAEQQLAYEILVDSVVPAAQPGGHGLLPRRADGPQVARVVEMQRRQDGLHLRLHRGVDAKAPVRTRNARAEGPAAAHRSAELGDELWPKVYRGVLYKRLPVLPPKSPA